MSAWTVFFILAGALFLLFAIPFWTGRRYRSAMRAYRGLKVGQGSPGFTFRPWFMAAASD